MPITDREKMRAAVVETGAVVGDQIEKAKAKGDIPVVDNEKQQEQKAAPKAQDEEFDERNEVEPSVEDETDDEVTAEAEPEPEKEPEPKKISQAAADRRIAKARREAAAAAAEAEALRQRIAELEKKDAKTDLTPEEIERLAEAKAEQKAAERIYNNACNNMYNAAGKEFGDAKKWENEYKEFVDDVGALPRSVVGPMLDMPNGHNILIHLVKNPDEAEKLMNMSPARQVRELAEISLKLEAATKKPVSRVPPPINPLGGRQKTTAGDLPTDNDNDDAWFAKREATKRERVWK